MQTRSDSELLREYVESGSEAAFTEIVRRYTDFVYSAALRQVGDEEQARDVTQTVFADLARKASSLRPGTVLIGWLCNAARLAAIEQLRRDRRRVHRERRAMEMFDATPETLKDWTAVRPVLDEALATLGNEDRNALLLRYFKSESFAAVGATFGISEDAAQKRVSRALDKLRNLLEQRGIKTTAAALSAALIANAVQSAPAGIVNSLSTAALANVAAGSSASAPLVSLANLKAIALAIALIGGVAGILTVRSHAQRELRVAQNSIQQLNGEIVSLRAENERLVVQINELEKLRGDAADVLRLRAETARLRRELNEQIASRSVTRAKETNAVAEAPTQVNIKALFLSAPSHTIAESMGILTDPQFRVILERLEGQENVSILNQGQVTTLCGRQAELSALDENASGLAATNRIIFEVIPDCSSSNAAINLYFEAIYSELGNFGTMEFRPAPESWSRDPVAVSVAPITVQPHTRYRTIITNSVALADGQTLMSVAELPSGAEAAMQARSSAPASGPRSLVLFVTPTLIDPAGNRILKEQ